MRKRRQCIRGKDWHSNGEGMNLDTLWVTGRLDPDTYLHYLRQYERQTRRGCGCKGYGSVVNGRIYPKMSKTEDNHFMGFMGEVSSLSKNEIDELSDTADRLYGQPPDYRRAVVRAIDKADTPVHVPYVGDFNLPSTSWAVCGHDQTPYPDDDDGQRLDGLLKDMEECGTSL